MTGEKSRIVPKRFFCFSSAHFSLCCQCYGSSCSSFSGLPKTIHGRRSVNKAQCCTREGEVGGGGGGDQMWCGEHFRPRGSGQQRGGREGGVTLQLHFTGWSLSTNSNVSRGERRVVTLFRTHQIQVQIHNRISTSIYLAMATLALGGQCGQYSVVIP